MAPSLYGSTPMGMLRPLANVSILRALPSGPKSERTLTESRPLPSGAGNGYSMVEVTQSRPLASKAMLIGFWMSGSEATSWASNPGGRCNDLSSSAGGRNGVAAMVGSSAGTTAGSSRMATAAARTTKRIAAPKVGFDVDIIRFESFRRERPNPLPSPGFAGEGRDSGRSLRSRRNYTIPSVTTPEDDPHELPIRPRARLVLR